MDSAFCVLSLLFADGSTYAFPVCFFCIPMLFIVVFLSVNTAVCLVTDCAVSVNVIS